MTDFKTKYGPWALVAGASEGLGAAFAEALAQRGLNLILIARRLDKLEKLAQHLSNLYSVETIAQSLDLADFEVVKTFVSQSKEGIGLLVYNAAYAPIGYFENISTQSLEQIVDVNIKAPLLLSKLISTQMIKRKKGGHCFDVVTCRNTGKPKNCYLWSFKSI